MLMDKYNTDDVRSGLSDSEPLLGDRIDSRKAFFTKLNRVGSQKRSTRNFRGSTYRRGNSFVGRGFSQRVVVKAHFKKHSSGSAGAGNLRGHLGYITRSGAGIDEEKPVLFGNVGGAEIDLSRSDFYNKCKDDRHHFRLIISPENGHEIADFEGYVSTVMGLVERDLRTKLEWVSAVHHDTDHVHAHVVLRGVNDGGKDLVIAPDYISRGIRGRASEVATKIIGERSLADLQRGMEEEVNALRVTSLDHFIERRGTDIEVQGENSVELKVNVRDLGRNVHDAFHGDLVRKRLEFLTTTSMARNVSRDIYHVRKDFKDELRLTSEKHDVIKQLYRSMPDEEQGVSIYKVGEHENDIVRGSIEKIAHMNELTDHKYMVVRDDKEELHYVPLSDNERNGSLQEGAVVEISVGMNSAEKADRNLLKVASLNDGVYTRDAHISHVEKSMKFIKTPESYVDYHELRLKALVKSGIVDELDDGRYGVPKDVVERGIDLTAELDAKSRKRQYAQVTSLSVSPIKDFVVYDINDENASNIQGRIEKIERVNKQSDKQYMTVRDGHEVLHYVPLSSSKQNEKLREGAIVDVSTGAYKGGADYNISKIASGHDGVYTRAAHQEFMVNSKKEIDDIGAYLDAHQTRLKTLEGAGITEERDDGSFKVPEDVIERGEALNEEIGEKSTKRGFAKVRTISAMPIESQIDVEARTFLDLEIYRHQKDYKLSYDNADKGTLDAIYKRQDWLVENDYAYRSGDVGEFVMKGDSLGKLYDAEMESFGRRVLRTFEANSLKSIVLDKDESVDVRFLGHADLHSGHHIAVVKNNDISIIKHHDRSVEWIANEPLNIVGSELNVNRMIMDKTREEALEHFSEKFSVNYNNDLDTSEPVRALYVGSAHLTDGAYAAVINDSELCLVKTIDYIVHEQGQELELSAGDNGFTNIKEVERQRELEIERSKPEIEIEIDDDDWWD